MDLNSETLLLAIRFGHCSAVHAATLREAGGAWAVEAVRENEALRAKVKRLSAIEAAARSYMACAHAGPWEQFTSSLASLEATLAAKENEK